MQISKSEYIIINMLRQPHTIALLSRGKDLAKLKLPDAPGVYFFKEKKDILYIGKATSLRDRVKSYFSRDLIETRGPQILKMVGMATSIDYAETASVLEALLLEAELIKKHQPVYNTKEKDDKSFNCVVITKETFPQVLVVRKKDIDFLFLKANGYPSSKAKLTTGHGKLKAVYGPFPHGTELKIALKIIRKIFPYRDSKCTPRFEQAIAHKQHTDNLKFVSMCKPCFNRQIGLCPGVCTGEIDSASYKKIIGRLRLFFEGKRERLMKQLEKEMKLHARKEEFEKAEEVKRVLFSLKHIQDIALLKREVSSPSHLFRGGIEGGVFRIEAYDLSHFGGKNIVGAMTVVEAGRPMPSEYRMFKIRTITDAHEVSGLKEMLGRRLKHAEWPLPNLIVVDGNEVQKRAAEEVIAEAKLSIPVVAVVKDERHKARKILGPNDGHLQASLLEDAHQAVLLANSEVHRFVLKFQRKQRSIR